MRRRVFLVSAEAGAGNKNSIFNCQGFGEEERQAHKGGSAEISKHYFITSLRWV
jgi:hypothetical protein